MTNKPISFYFHIPFCVKKCDYCAFFSLAAQGEELKQRYFEALLRQLSLFPTDRIVKTVYFGGGTPPILGIERLCRLIGAVSERFELADDCEITVEVNPGTVDRQAIAELKKAGANRLSVGIQSANDRVLKSIGRIHTFEQARECIDFARNAGFNNISADVIFALPSQIVDELEDGLKQIISTGITHISVYSLQLEAGTPLFERRNELIFPDEDGEERQYESVCRILSENGFEHYEISSFSKPGFRSRHNMNYWKGGEYFGFGAGAHSFCFGKRFSSPGDIGAFIEKSFTSLLEPTDFNESPFLTQTEAEEERIMLGLRTADGALIPDSAAERARRIAELGYGTFENRVLKLNSRGFRVSNSIIAQILT